MKKINETRNYSLEERDSKMNWCVKRTKRFIQFYIVLKNFYILASAITGWISISALASLLGIPIAITSSGIMIKEKKEKEAW